MPSPIDILLDPLSLIVMAMYGGVMLWEALFPARRLPLVKYWKLKGVFFFLVFFFLSTDLPLLIDPILGPYRLFDLSGWGSVSAAVAGILLYELGLYGWHRIMHKVPLLWRTFHQMHHSAERTDTFGAFFFSPLDMIGFIGLSSLCFSFFIGLSPSSITIVLLTTTFFSIFQHANIKTPQWLGYLIQRPESHAFHHARGIHRNNYSDLPVFDILFGTFTNPRSYRHAAGFYDGASAHMAEMLTFHDIFTSPEEVEKSGQDKKSRASHTLSI